jgi:hypothetical protein
LKFGVLAVTSGIETAGPQHGFRNSDGLLMQGAFYLVWIGLVLYVVIWYVRNEGRGDGEPTIGLIAMTPLDPNAVADKKRRRDRKRWTRD